MTIKQGDRVKYNDGDGRIFTIYSTEYQNGYVSLCIYGYNDTEQDNLIHISNITKVKG